MATNTNKDTDVAAETATKPSKNIATYKPGVGIPGLRRVVSVSDAKAVFVDIEKDLVWEAENGHRQDVSDVPDSLISILKAEVNADGTKVFSFKEE